MTRFVIVFGLSLVPLLGQEAVSGFDLRATVTGEAVSNGTRTDAGIRSVFYPTWKLSEHWVVSGGLQVMSRPFFPSDLDLPGHSLRFRVLNANLTYSRVWKKASLIVRAGQMPSAMGSYLLRYDDADNPLVDAPMEYGYYGGGITTLGLAGVEADVTLGKWDARAQFVNSSPADARSVFDDGQFGSWLGGAGYTIRQGLHVGLAGYRGPYLYQSMPYYFPGPGGLHNLPASGWGVDAEWDKGHWNTSGEWHRFDLAYYVIPTLREDAGYVEVKRVLHPRWYVAGRAGYLHPNFAFGGETYEAVVGFRPNGWQIIKVAYGIERERPSGNLSSTFTAQLVTTLHPLSLSWR
jgi:hypothetical protein